MGRKQEYVDIQHLYQNAITLHQQGEIRRAITKYKQLIELVPDVAEIHFNLGLALFELDEYEKSIAAYTKASELNPQDGDIFYNLGLACKMNKDFTAAEKSYLKAFELSDDIDDILYNLGCCYQDFGKTEQACVVFEQLLKIHPDHLSALNNLAYLQHLQGHYDDARELYGQILELDPNRQSALHMYASLSGGGDHAPPQEYVRELFDGYSHNFEENLVNDLEYNTFCILRQAVCGLSEEKKHFENALDLGCGTGLAGVAFQSACTRLTGIDLSENMITLAAEKRLYHALHCTDIVEFLHETENKYDLFIAADVVPYLGSLTPLFSATELCTSNNALFCLSSESTEVTDWEVQPTGRYAHSPDYIIRVAKRYGWSVHENFTANIRKENDAWLTGTILVFGRNKSSRFVNS